MPHLQFIFHIFVGCNNYGVCHRSPQCGFSADFLLFIIAMTVRRTRRSKKAKEHRIELILAVVVTLGWVAFFSLRGGTGDKTALAADSLRADTIEAIAQTARPAEASTAVKMPKKEALPAIPDSLLNTSAFDHLEEPVTPDGVSETIRRRYAYTVSYNHTRRNPNWVAWKLTADHASGSINRKNYDFEDDPDMPSPKATKKDYYRSGYDRGHLCPAADNKWSGKAMAECFLMTNMCPQDNSLNSGLWNTIEKQCRDWALEYGTIYIACGPIYLNNDNQRKIGHNKVVVPDAFFKVILCLEGKPKAIGFVCRNHSQKGRKKTEFVNTVDDVERITGYDFFSQLPDSLENAIESRCSYIEW